MTKEKICLVIFISAFIFSLSLLQIITPKPFAGSLRSDMENMTTMYLSDPTGSDMEQLTTETNLRVPLASSSRVLSSSCYNYSQLQALNHCCPMLIYDAEDLATCAATSLDPLNRKREHWVFVGHSRVRYLLFALLKLYKGPTTKYKNKISKGKWTNSEKWKEWPPHKWLGKHEHFQIKNMKLPLRMSFYWDPDLLLFPDLIRKWNGTELWPTRLHFGMGLHFMKDNIKTFNAKGMVAAAEPFKASMRVALPLIKHLAQTIPSTWQLEEYVQNSKTLVSLKGVWSHKNIDYYNNYIIEELKGSKVAIWDSYLPLSELFINECELANHNVANGNWQCSDPIHQGYAAFKLYANIWLNHVCNQALPFNGTYC